MLNVIILANVIDLSDNLAHEHPLSEESNYKSTDTDKCLCQTTDVSQESQDIVNFALILVKDSVTTKINCNNVAIFVRVDVLIGFNVIDLEILVFDFLSKLHKRIFQLKHLPLDVKICTLADCGI